MQVEIKDVNRKSILFYAFRHSLNRMTPSVPTVVEELISNWECLDYWEKDFIVLEINKKVKSLGDSYQKVNKEQWDRILKMYDDEEEKIKKISTYKKEETSKNKKA
jgi:hypothetical protein